MKTSAFFRYGVGIVAVAALLAGCTSGGSSSSAATGLASSGFGPTGAVAPRWIDPAIADARREMTPAKVAEAKARFHPHRAWASPDVARSPRLLFVSDFAADSVNIYTMPALTLKGQATSFTAPRGECQDSSGRIWVVDYTAQSITRLERTGDVSGEIDDHDGFPESCAVDPSTGDLAVTNFFGSTGAGGNLTIYHNPPTGGKTVVTDPDFYYYFYAGYDTSGDLWVDGETDAGVGVVASCTTSGCTTISLTGTIYAPGFIQWTTGQRMWYVADRDCGSSSTFCIYPVSPSGSLGTAIDLVDPQGRTVCNMKQGVMTNHMSGVYAGGVDDSTCGGSGGINSVARWNFPAGGGVTDENDATVDPWGAAISMK